jgi:amino acid transporter
VVQVVSIAAIGGLATSLFSSIYAYSRLIFAMARDGELPAFLVHLRRARALLPTLPLAIQYQLGFLDRLK